MTDKKYKKIAFVCPYPYDTAAGQRFRYEQYLNLLNTQGFSFVILSFFDKSTFGVLYKRGYYIRKIWGIIKGFTRRIFHLFLILPCSYVFIFREASPIGYPVFEWVLSKVFKKRIIYDFDDAIWLSNTTSENKIVAKLKYHQKVELICKWSYKVSVGNQYLANFASKFTDNVIVNPTTIDTENYHNCKKNQKTKEVVIGWTGSHSTLKYLHLIYPILKKLEEKLDFAFHVIADKEIFFDLKKFKFTRWNKETEVDDLLLFNIGVMPLNNDEWEKGKCGFKALQYMSLGIPAVVSPVGVNTEIISHGVDGFCCLTETDWLEKLSLLIEKAEIREKLGEAAIDKVNSKFSVSSNSENFLFLFS